MTNNALKKGRTFTTFVRYVIFFKQKGFIQLLALRNPRSFILKTGPPVKQVITDSPPHAPDSSAHHTTRDSNQISCFGASAGFLKGMHRNICCPVAQLARCTWIRELVFSRASGTCKAKHNLVQYDSEEIPSSQMLPSLYIRFQTYCHFDTQKGFFCPCMTGKTLEIFLIVV